MLFPQRRRGRCSYIDYVTKKNTGIEVQVVNWHNGEPQEVAIHFIDLDKMLTLTPEAARNFAFCLMQCADFIEPPFQDLDDDEN